ncbi:MAG: YpdA family putative bacillithiol disulfide reductase [Bryobacteraceae bacterium]
MTASHEALIVGAGPTGLACGIELGRKGVDAVLIEKGCVVNSLYNYPTNMVFFTTPELLEIGGIPMTSLNEKPNRTEALKYYRRVADHFHLNVRQYERVETIAGGDGAFTVATRDRNGCQNLFQVNKVILATGYYDVPNLLGVPGEDLPKVIHYYKESHPYYNHDVLVCGGKNSAAIAALELHWNGARVTLAHRGPSLHRHVKYWIRPNLDNRIKNGEIRAYFRSTLRRILPDSVVLDTPDGEVTLSNDFVFAMTGYSPDVEFLRAAGIEFDPETERPRTNAETLESDRPGIHLAGVIVAGMHTNEIFIENGRFHGERIAEAIARALGK